MAERRAGFAVLVVAGEENIPAKREQLVEYEGNKMIVAVDPELPTSSDLSSPIGTAAAGLPPGIGARGGRRGRAGCGRGGPSALKRAQSVRLAFTGIDKSSTGARGNRGDRPELEGGRRIEPRAAPQAG